MKIIRTSAEVKRKEELKRIANEGCDKCPCCGESKDSLYYLRIGLGIDRGIKSGLSYLTTTRKGTFQIDVYECKTCGAKWESEPYEV